MEEVYHHRNNLGMNVHSCNALENNQPDRTARFNFPIHFGPDMGGMREMIENHA